MVTRTCDTSTRGMEGGGREVQNQAGLCETGVEREREERARDRENGWLEYINESGWCSLMKKCLWG